MIFLFSKHPNSVFESYDDMIFGQVTPRLKKVAVAVCSSSNLVLQCNNCNLPLLLKMSLYL